MNFLLKIFLIKYSDCGFLSPHLFLYPPHILAIDTPLNMIFVGILTKLAKTNFSFASSCQFEITFKLGI